MPPAPGLPSCRCQKALIGQTGYRASQPVSTQLVSPPTALSPKQAKWGHGERKLREVGGWREEVTSS